MLAADDLLGENLHYKLLLQLLQFEKINRCGEKNCDYWVKEKSAVFDQGWSLLDQAGYLRTDI